MWEGTVRDLAMQRKVAEPKEKFDPKTRLDELLRIATDRGLTGRLLLPPKGKAAEKKAVMIGRLRFDSLVKAMSDVEITFAGDAVAAGAWGGRLPSDWEIADCEMPSDATFCGLPPSQSTS